MENLKVKVFQNNDFESSEQFEAAVTKFFARVDVIDTKLNDKSFFIIYKEKRKKSSQK